MNKTILLVDDNKMFLEIEKEFLQYTKTEVMTAYDGLEALNITKTKRPDLIFMDLEMPKMDGASCCRAIKADLALACIPLVMVTSRKTEEDRDLSLSSGCDDFISKPLDRDIFLGIARSFIPDLDRRELRIKVSIKASLYVKNEIIPCTLYNLSSGGAYVVADYCGIPNEVINISFTLPSGYKIECHGRIAWINRINSTIPKGLGVKFALMPQYAKEALLEFVKNSK
jgi:CheY-like chemotaxis protein